MRKIINQYVLSLEGKAEKEEEDEEDSIAQKVFAGLIKLTFFLFLSFQFIPLTIAPFACSWHLY
jgi:hypothetical protein